MKFKKNPFYSMGSNIDISDPKVKGKIIEYIENNSHHTYKGYTKNYLNVYLDNKGDCIQLYLPIKNKNMTLKEKMNELVIHHTNNIVWRSDIDICLPDDRYIIRPHVKDEHGCAIIQYINTDISPYIEKGTSVVAQINAFAYDLKVFKKGELNKNHFHFSIEDDKKTIYLSDNNIMLASLFKKEPEYSTLNYVKGDVLSVKNISSDFLGEKMNYCMIEVDTEFGLVPIIYSNQVITYGKQVKVGDNVEALCSIVGDIMLYHESAKIKRDKCHYFDVVKKAFETKRFDYLYNILSENCEYISDRHTFAGRDQIIEKLQYITDEGYKDKELKLSYAEIFKNPVKHFKKGEEVLCLGFEESDLIEGEINFHINKDKLIDKIYYTSDSEISFKIYQEDGTVSFSEEDKEIFKNLIDLMRKKELTESEIYGVLNCSYEEVEIAEKLIDFLQIKKTSKNLFSDLIKYELELVKKYEDSHPHRYKIKYNDFLMREKKEYYPKSLNKKIKSWRTVNYDDYGSNSILEVVTNGSEIGEIRTKLGYKPRCAICDLELCYGSLEELKENNRNSLRKIDLFAENDYDYSFADEIERINEDIRYYDSVRIWTKHNSINDFLLPYYFINKFYNKIKNKEVKLIYIDELPDRENLKDLFYGEFEKLLETEKLLTKEELKKYKDEWNTIVSQKCDIRKLEKNKIIYTKYEDYFDQIIKLLSKYKSIKRKQFIGKLTIKKLIYNADIIVYNHIIDIMIENNLINSKNYKIEQFLPIDEISVAKKDSE